MAKRFLDTGFLKQKWIRKLKAKQKIFLIYLMLECDNGGIIDLDLEDAEFWIGEKIGNPLEFLPEGYLIPLEKSTKFFQPKFIEWQYPNFPHSKVHQQAQAKNILAKHNLFNLDTQTLNLPKTYPNFTQTLPDGQVNGNGNAIDNANGYIKDENDFDFFWLKYHAITGKEKTDKESALKYWNKLKQHEKEKAIGNIQNYANTQENKLYLKKARTYLSDKNFNDEFNKTRETEFNDPIGRLEAVVNKKKYTP